MSQNDDLSAQPVHPEGTTLVKWSRTPSNQIGDLIGQWRITHATWVTDRGFYYFGVQERAPVGFCDNPMDVANDLAGGALRDGNPNAFDEMREYLETPLNNPEVEGHMENATIIVDKRLFTITMKDETDEQVTIAIERKPEWPDIIGD